MKAFVEGLFLEKQYREMRNILLHNVIEETRKLFVGDLKTHAVWCLLSHRLGRHLNQMI